MKQRSSIILSCVIWIILCLLISGLSGWVTSHNISSWYVHIQKPIFTPPSWVFGPVWTILYIMLGVAGGLLWLKKKALPLVFAAYLVQLLFNFTWSFVFFGAHQIGWAFVNIVLLWLSILTLEILSFRSYRVVFYIVLPYFLWVSFASVLNASIAYLN